MKTLVILSGTPAAGKSTLITYLNQCFECEVLQIDRLLSEYSEFSPGVYHECRTRVILMTEEIIKSSEKDVLIVEDTNHLRSLVKPFRKIAKVMKVKFAHFVLRVDLDVAIDRNNMREKRVSNETIEKIHAQIEKEDFFKESVYIDSSIVFSIEEVREWILKAKVVEEDEEKAYGINSFLHLADCELRKVVNQVISAWKGDKKYFAKCVLETKKKIIFELPELNLENYESVIEASILTLRNFKPESE